jgi:peroxiredoxin family protein
MTNAATDFAARLETLESRVAELETRSRNRVCVAIRIGTYDAFLYGLAFAVAAAASGSETHVFVAQWGLAALRDPNGHREKAWLHQLFGWMLPRHSARLPLAQLNMGGTGTPMIRYALKKAGAMTVEEYLAVCVELGVQFMICPTSAATLGLDLGDFDPKLGVRYCGMTEYLELVANSTANLDVG